MNLDILARPRKRLGNLSRIVTAALGLLAADVGTKSVSAADSSSVYRASGLPTNNTKLAAAPRDQKKGLSDLLDPDSRFVGPKAQDDRIQRDALDLSSNLVEVSERFEDWLVKAGEPIAQILKEAGDDQQTRVDALNAASKRAKEELDSAGDEHIKKITELVQEGWTCARLLHDFVPLLVADPGQLLGKLRTDEAYREKARIAIARTSQLLARDSEDLQSIFYRMALVAAAVTAAQDQSQQSGQQRQ